MLCFTDATCVFKTLSASSMCFTIYISVSFVKRAVGTGDKGQPLDKLQT